MIGLFAVFTAGCMRGASYATYDPRIILAGFSINGYEAPVVASKAWTILTYVSFGIFCFLPIIIDVIESVSFSRSRRKSAVDLEMTYKKNLWNSGRGRNCFMNLVEVKDFSFSYPECSHKVLEHVNLKIKKEL